MNDYFYDVYKKVVNKEKIGSIDFLNEIIRNYEMFKPTWHALGFIHCQLAKFKEGELRLHVWNGRDKHSSEQPEKIHDHLFSLNSYIMCGAIKNDFFELYECSSDAFDYQSFTVNYTSNGSTLIPRAQFFKVSKVISEVIVAGNYYAVNSSQFHRSSLTGSATSLTLVATFDSVDKAPTTLISDRSRMNDEIIRGKIYYDVENWKNILIELRGRC